MSAAKILPYYTIKDWEWWEGKWELIEGIPFAMSPAPIPKHQRIVINLTQQLNEQLKVCKKCKVYASIDWQITSDTILQPDVLVVCGDAGKRLNFPPELIIEILSPSTALKDRNSKYQLYLQQKVKYYLIIDPLKEATEIYELINDEYQLQQSNNYFHFTFSHDCFANIDFSDIWE